MPSSSTWVKPGLARRAGRRAARRHAPAVRRRYPATPAIWPPARWSIATASRAHSLRTCPRCASVPAAHPPPCPAPRAACSAGWRCCCPAGSRASWRPPAAAHRPHRRTASRRLPPDACVTPADRARAARLPPALCRASSTSSVSDARTWPWSRNASIVAGGIVSTVSRPISSSTYSTSLYALSLTPVLAQSRRCGLAPGGQGLPAVDCHQLLVMHDRPSWHWRSPPCRAALQRLGILVAGGHASSIFLSICASMRLTKKLATLDDPADVLAPGMPSSRPAR